jgi:hypothetical protein
MNRAEVERLARGKYLSLTTYKKGRHFRRYARLGGSRWG